MKDCHQSIDLYFVSRGLNKGLSTFFVRSNKTLADSLDNANDPNDPIVNRLLRSMATQAMSNALYFSTGSCAEEEFHHYGE